MSDDKKQTEKNKPEPIKKDMLTNSKMINAFVLYNQGVSCANIASVYGVTSRTIERWVKELKENCSDMVFPNIETAKKRLEGMVPMAMDALEDFIGSPMHRMGNAAQAMKAVEHVLKTVDVVKDKSTLELDVTNMTDEELLEGIVGVKKGKNE